MDNFDECVNLVQQFLIITYKDLIESYIWMRDNQEICQPLIEQSCELWDYIYYYKSYLKLKNKRHLMDKQKNIIETYKSLKKPKPLSRKQKSLVNQFYRHDRNIKDSELFYRSPRFQIFTFGEGNGEVVIKQARKEVERCK